MVVNGDGSYSYDPPANFTGSDTFTYTIDNALNQPSIGTVTITVKDRVIVVASGGTGNCKPADTVRDVDGGWAAAPTGKDLVFVQSGSYSNRMRRSALNDGQTLVRQLRESDRRQSAMPASRLRPTASALAPSMRARRRR